MIHASVYGRLGGDPVERKTRNGNAMTTASIAVSAGRLDAPEETVWVDLVAFGRATTALARHRKGDLLAAMGPLHRTRFTGRDGQAREGWSLTVEALVSARTVRPVGSGKRARPSDATPTEAGLPGGDNEPFDDEIPL